MSCSSSKKAHFILLYTAWSSRAGCAQAGLLPIMVARPNGTRSRVRAGSNLLAAKRIGRRSLEVSRQFCVSHEVNDGTVPKDSVAWKARTHGARDRCGTTRTHGYVY